METYTAGLVQQLYPLDRPYAPYRTEEDAYYASNSGFVMPGWVISVIAAVSACRRRRPVAETASIHVTQIA